jgi:hypothetical protein
VVSIAAIRGRARGAGSEFVLACDLRFASRELAILGQPEVSVALVPGGGPMARLPQLVGRGRALEILLSGHDVDGELAERYGYVNRALPDRELDAFVDALAARIGSFDKKAVAETKHYVDQVSLPDDDLLPRLWMPSGPPPPAVRHGRGSEPCWSTASSSEAMSNCAWVTTSDSCSRPIVPNSAAKRRPQGLIHRS